MKKYTFNVLRMKQPLGEFYVGVIDSKTLCEITYADIRGIEEGKREIAAYSGIQRTLNLKRVKEIQQYVETYDATFPTSVILAVDAVCVKIDSTGQKMTLQEFIDSEDPTQSIPFNKIAKIIDGQHRIAGLKNLTVDEFEINVTIFVDIDIAEQANIFSTVNLAQTKVNKSLVYDLYDYAKERSPQKTGHNIAVALNKKDSSPFFQKIKRLGMATEGVFTETITQATFVQALIPYLTEDEVKDRDLLLRGKKLPLIAEEKILEKRIFINFFRAEKDLDITKAIWTYFEAVKDRWPIAWGRNPNLPSDKGYMLNKTNGFKALMKFMGLAFIESLKNNKNFQIKDLARPELIKMPSKNEYKSIFLKVSLKDDDFNVGRFPPGTSGEVKLLKTLKESL